MNTKQLLLSLVMLGTLVVGGTKKVFAQEDESWYKNRPKKQEQTQMTRNSSRSVLKQTTTAQRTACDFVVNGDMETQLTAPSHTGNMGGGGMRPINQGYSNTPDQLADWYSPTLGTPDFLATHAVNTIQGNDVNPSLETRIDGAPTVSGSSTVRSGIGEIGLYSRQAYNDGSTDPPDRVSEYATVKLGSTLTNARYYAEMWVSLSHSTLSCNYGIDTGFGMWFTPDDNFKNLSSRNYLTLPTTQFISNRTPIAEGDINNGILGNTTWKRISGILQGKGENYVTIGAFNSNLNSQPLRGKNGSLPNTYVFVDDFQLYKIPTAGVTPEVSCGVYSATIGEGCPIPGATYTWSAPGISGLPVNSTTIQTTVSPIRTTVYTLTVNLPDGTTSSSSVMVNTNAAPDDPQVQTPYWTCVYGPGPVYGAVDNYDPKLTYTITSTGNIYAYATGPIQESDGRVRWVFRLRSSREGSTGLVTVKATNKCGAVGTTTFSVRSPGSECHTPPSSRIAGYPNPATDYVQVPAEAVKDAVLLDGRGKAVKVPNASGRLDVQNLPEGLYNLQLMQDGKLINQRIQVKH